MNIELPNINDGESTFRLDATVERNKMIRHYSKSKHPQSLSPERMIPNQTQEHN